MEKSGTRRAICCSGCIGETYFSRVPVRHCSHILGLAAARFYTLVTAAPVGTRAAPVPDNARRPDQNHFCNASMKLAPAGARLGTRVFCNKSWAAVRFSSSPGSLFILLIKRLDNKRARELWPRSSTYTDCLEFYGGVAVPLGPRALGFRPNGGCVEALGATAWRRRGLILRTARMCHAPMR